jgi:hypothetical protein
VLTDDSECGKVYLQCGTCMCRVHCLTAQSPAVESAKLCFSPCAPSLYLARQADHDSPCALGLYLATCGGKKSASRHKCRQVAMNVSKSPKCRQVAINVGKCRQVAMNVGKSPWMSASRHECRQVAMDVGKSPKCRQVTKNVGKSP